MLHAKAIILYTGPQSTIAAPVRLSRIFMFLLNRAVRRNAECVRAWRLGSDSA